MSTSPVQDIGLLTGTNLKVVSNFNVAPGFDWIDPPITKDSPWIVQMIAKYFPTESNYHPLLVNSDYEIAANMFSINGANLTDTQKHEYEAKVAKIVKESDYLQTYNSCNMGYVILLIIGLIMLWFGVNSFNVWGVFVLVVVMHYAYSEFISYPMAKARGVNRWNQFVTNYSSALNSGSNPQNILSQLKSDNIREQDIQAKYNAAGMGNNASLVGTNVGLIAGATAGIISSIMSHNQNK